MQKKRDTIYSMTMTITNDNDSTSASPSSPSCKGTSLSLTSPQIMGRMVRTGGFARG